MESETPHAFPIWIVKLDHWGGWISSTLTYDISVPRSVCMSAFNCSDEASAIIVSTIIGRSRFWYSLEPAHCSIRSLAFMGQLEMMYLVEMSEYSEVTDTPNRDYGMVRLTLTLLFDRWRGEMTIRGMADCRQWNGRAHLEKVKRQKTEFYGKFIAHLSA